MNNKYRFENGSLYQWSEQHQAYIHVFKSFRAKTKAQAIRMYEESM